MLSRVGAGLGVLVFCACLACVRQKPAADQEFRQVWSKLEQSNNWCFGFDRLNQTKSTLMDETLGPSERCRLLQRLSLQHLRLAENEQALQTIEQAIAIAREQKLMGLIPDLRAHRAIVWLRLAEVRNCVLTETQSSCIFPLDENAVHLDKKPAEQAFEDLLFYLLEQDATESESSFFISRRWLLNIAAMQLGRYPDAVPKEFRLSLPHNDGPEEGLVFKDVASGVGIVDKNLAGGAAVGDLDGDGLLDILSSSCDYREPLRYYRNTGTGTFQDMTQASGLMDQTGAFNVRLADYDGDGDQDILLLRGAFLRELGQVRNSLLENDGSGHFVDVTKRAGLAEPARPTGTACWGDFDGDGDLDLFVGNETVPKADGSIVNYPCQLFRNNGDKTFTDTAKQSGVEGLIYVKGVAAGDMDNDGDLDLFVSNFAHRNVPKDIRGRNLLFRNRGDGVFDEVGQEMGIDGPDNRGFATWFFDYNNDGWLDLFVVCYETEMEYEVGPYFGKTPPAGRTRLFRNNQGRSFTNVSYPVNIAVASSTMGASFGDLDNDGFLDMYLGTGSAFYHHLVPNRMLQNKGGDIFEDVTIRRGLGHLQKGHGIAFCDLDNDGDQDIYAQMGGNLVGDAFSNSLFENPGNQNRFVYLNLASDYQVVGARIKVDLGDQQIHRAVGMVSSFGHTPLRQEIGLGSHTKIESIEVRWPSGTVQTFLNPPTDVLLELKEGLQDFKTLELKGFQLRAPQPGDPFCAPAKAP